MSATLAWRFDTSDFGPANLGLSRARQRLERAKGPRQALRCRACGHDITDPRARISVRGSHTHACTNPERLRFGIGCFADAPGCREVGAATAEHTWFPGYAWRISLCVECNTHLGWGFGNGRGERFFGLILGRLIAPDESPGKPGG